MSWSAVVEFPAVDATAGVKAAWIAAAEADGDWWADGVDGPWLDTAAQVTPGELLAGLAGARVCDIVTTAGPAGPAGSAVPAVPAPPACANWVDPCPGPVPAALAGWVRPEWWFAPVRDEVRALLTLPPGVVLQARLVELAAHGSCPADHREDGDVDIAAPGPGIPDASGAPGAPACVGVVDPMGVPVPGSSPGFPCTCQLLVAAAWEACASWSAWQAQRALVDAVGGEPVIITPTACARGSLVDPAREDVAPMLALSPDSTATRIDASRDLARYPDLAALIEQGLIFTPGVRAVLAETANLDAESRATVVSAVVAKVRARRDQGRRPRTASELRKATKAAVQALAREAVQEARRTAFARRRTSLTPDGDGMAWFSALIRDVDAHRIANRLTAQAAAGAQSRREAGDDRTADQVRADLLVDLLLGRTPADLTQQPATPGSPADHDAPGDHHDGPGADPSASTGPLPRTGRADISVVCTLAMLVGLTHDTAEIPGLGPVPADIARELAADGRWRLVITDPATGQVIATGSRTYAPSAALARLIRAREPSCRMPGCNRQSVNCDLDHTVPWPAEPGTVESNIGPLCRRHHNHKTHHGYHLANEPPPVRPPGAHGTTPNPAPPALTGWTWTMPSGLTHTDHPDPPLENW
ncbi:MAG: hypothetical protein QG597_3079 [Actinomycetota bacterium]|nr:hypothetical protein [Actinomycetota bacterium]